MSEQAKKYMMRFWIMPVALSCVAYYWAAVALAKVSSRFIEPAPMDLAKMVLSHLADLADIDVFRVDFPAAFAANITAATEQPDCALFLFHKFVDVTPGTFMYSLFPLFFLAVFVGFGIRAGAKISHMDAEETAKNQKHLRGTRRVDAATFCKMSRRVKDPATVVKTHTGYLVVSDKKLREHTLILGATGSGKSQLILNYLRDIVLKKGGIKLVAVDRKGELWAHFGNPKKDFLFHPYDQRGVSWSIFDEVKVELDDLGKMSKIPDDVTAITSILFQLDTRKGDDTFWYAAAASVANSAICYCLVNGLLTMKALLDVLAKPAVELDKLFATLPPALQAGRQGMGDPTGKQAGSVLAICAETMKALSPFYDTPGGWSAREWINSGSGNLFISTAGRNDVIFTRVASLVIDLVGRELKQFPDDGQGRTKVLFVIDELGSYPQITTLIWLLTLGRSKGVATIIANQTISKIEKVYGRDEAHNLFANLKTKYIFMMPEPTDADYCAKMIGNAEVERTSKSENRSAGIFGRRNGDSNNTGKQITQDLPFLASDLQNLQAGEAVTIHPNLLPSVAKVQYLPVTDCPARQAEFLEIPRREVNAKTLSLLLSQQAAPAKQERKEQAQPTPKEQPKAAVAPMQAREDEPMEEPDESFFNAPAQTGQAAQDQQAPEKEDGLKIF